MKVHDLLTHTVGSQFCGTFSWNSKAWSFFKSRTNSNLSIFSWFFRMQVWMKLRSLELPILFKSVTVQDKKTSFLHVNPFSLASKSSFRLGELMVFLNRILWNISVASPRLRQWKKVSSAKLALRGHSLLMNFWSGSVGHISYWLWRHTWFDGQNWGSIVVSLQRLDLKILWIIFKNSRKTYSEHKLLPLQAWLDQ